MKTKGQAAMEFLMTYGWAILAAIIVIGVLAVYLTDLPGSGGTTYLNSPLYLVASNIDDATPDAVNIEIRNDGADTIDVQGISVDFGDFTCGTLAARKNVTVGSSDSFSAQCSADVITAGDSYSGDIAVSYYIGGSAVTQTTGGSISSTAV
ncbi:MAG: hypothetical protein KKD18_03360 [Nanoarchaeota archaeon]|nr:hypothetical protein [Nanoarchaeota archaeon]MBU0977428.1 hypothetical protein [Nanoarchaeota archaeon]